MGSPSLSLQQKTDLGGVGPYASGRGTRSQAASTRQSKHHTHTQTPQVKCPAPNDVCISEDGGTLWMGCGSRLGKVVLGGGAGTIWQAKTEPSRAASFLGGASRGARTRPRQDPVLR